MPGLTSCQKTSRASTTRASVLVLTPRTPAERAPASRAMPKWPAEQSARRGWAGRCPFEGCVLPCGHTEPCKRGEIEEEDYEVERITAERTVRGTTQYLVKWVGWPDEDSTWEAADALENAQGVLARWKEVCSGGARGGGRQCGPPPSGPAASPRTLARAAAVLPRTHDDEMQEVEEVPLPSAVQSCPSGGSCGAGAGARARAGPRDGSGPPSRPRRGARRSAPPRLASRPP